MTDTGEKCALRYLSDSLREETEGYHGTCMPVQGSSPRSSRCPTKEDDVAFVSNEVFNNTVKCLILRKSLSGTDNLT